MVHSIFYTQIMFVVAAQDSKYIMDLGQEGTSNWVLEYIFKT